VKLGPAKRRLQSDDDKKITAYHEAGHAIVTHFMTKTDPVQRISIVARGMSLGHTFIPPAHDRTHETKSRLLEQISAMLGGRAAEEMVFNEMTAGAANDIEHATALARAMVEDFGMSSLGPINFGSQSDEADSTPWDSGDISEAMKEKVDMAVSNIMEEARKQALASIKKNRKLLDKVADALLDKETLDQDDFEKIVGKKS
jgi:cell division protease FtsH